ncbi:acyl-CoA reductase [Cohnella pontilimi]|nr:acyl-CoA reductase [Cohnella pontilimi]
MTFANLPEIPRRIGCDDAVAAAERLRPGITAARARPVAYYLNLLDEVGKLWSNPGYRAPIVPMLAASTGHSPELVEYEIDTLSRLLTRDYLASMVEQELGSINILDSWIQAPGLRLRRQSRGLLLHNLAGNALIVAPLSLAYGLITKNVNLVKIPTDEPIFAAAFAQSILSVSPELADELAVLQWSGSDQSVYRALFPLLDGVIHWGGEQSQRSIAHLAAEHDVPLLAHGPKFSFTYLDGPLPCDLADLAEGIASDLVLWEQKACSSPRFILVRADTGYSDAEAIAEALALSLQKATVRWPVTPSDVGRGVRVAAHRHQYELQLGLSGQGKVLASADSQSWTVVLSKILPDHAAINASTDRFVFVCPVASNEEVLAYLSSFGRHQRRLFQVMAYEGNDSDFLDTATQLGVARISRIGEMSCPAPGASHDGGYNLTALTTLHSCPDTTTNIK